MPNRSAAIVALPAAIVLLAGPAAAAVSSTAVVPPPKGAPAILASCAVAVAPNGNASVRYEASDRDASRPLERVTVIVRVYDDVGTKTGQYAVPSAGMGVAPGETGRYEAALYELGYSKAMAVRSATCTLSAAVFHGGTAWSPGKRWKGRLLSPLPTP